MPHEHQAADDAVVMVDVTREGRGPVTMLYDDYVELYVEDLVGTTVTMFVRCRCGKRVNLQGPLVVVAATVRRRGAQISVVPS